MSKSFDSATWQAVQDPINDNPRAEMIPALERDHLKVGLLRIEVRALLGAPDQETEKADTYLLGPSPVGVDFETYVIEYREDRVTAFGLRRS